MQVKNDTQKWIFKHTKQEIPMMALLIFGNVLFAVCGVVSALFSKSIIDAAQNGSREELVRFGAMLAGIITAQLFLRMLCKRLEIKIQGKVEIKIKTELFTEIMKKDYVRITSVHSGELMTRLTSDVLVVTEGASTILPSAVSMVTRLIAAFAVLLTLDRSFAIILAAAGVLLFGFTRLFRGRMKHLHKRVQESDGKVRSFMQESIESILVVKIFDIANKMKAQSAALLTENYEAKLKRNAWSILANIGFSAAFSFGYLFAVLWSAFRLWAGSFSFGTLTAVIQLVNQVQAPVTSLSGLMPRYYAMLASADRIIEIENFPESVTLNAPDMDIEKIYDGMRYVEFRDVSFGYGRETIIENGSFRISKNDFVVISGISGIGKSTLFKLMTGVLPPDSGEICVLSGDKSYAVDKHMRPLFAYVPQGNMLMSGTVRDNIKLVNEFATDEQVMEAARVSCADAFIRELPEGLDTVLQENGRGLSEGQIQRLAVARAVLSGAPVMLLDEATSALDEETEEHLLKNIRALKNKTCIIISHKHAAYAICNVELKISDRHIELKKLK